MYIFLREEIYFTEM